MLQLQLGIRYKRLIGRLACFWYINEDIPDINLFSDSVLKACASTSLQHGVMLTCCAVTSGSFWHCFKKIVCCTNHEKPMCSLCYMRGVSADESCKGGAEGRTHKTEKTVFL